MGVLLLRRAFTHDYEKNYETTDLKWSYIPNINEYIL